MGRLVRGSRRRAFLVLVAALVAAWCAAGAGAALAAVDGAGAVTTAPVTGSSSSSTSTTASSAPPTTLAPLPGSGTTAPDSTTTTASTDASSTTTTGPGAGGSSPAPGGTTGGGSAGGGSGGSGAAGGGGQSGPPTTGAAAADPHLEAVSAAVPRTGASTTWPLLTALAPLSRYGLTQLQTALIGFGRFPVAGPATYTDDWLEYRPGSPPHLHEGIDIDAAQGTPLRSPTDGVLTYSDSDPDGYGLTALVTQPDHTTFVMAHMSATVLGLASGTRVSTGQVIGFVGSSGDATGPHLHFEVHPLGGAGVDGKPLLDGWIRDAMAAAPGLIAAFQNATSPAAQPQVSPVPVSVPAPARQAGSGRALSPGNAASLRAPSWAASAVVRVVTVLLVLAAAAIGAEMLRRRTRTATAAPARSEG